MKKLKGLRHLNVTEKGVFKSYLNIVCVAYKESKIEKEICHVRLTLIYLHNPHSNTTKCYRKSTYTLPTEPFTTQIKSLQEVLKKEF